ncbi:DEAD/DEAH box helicase family protein [Candidatus Gracilibacteria bacterium]|nr:DEAD/DEAH box helicase family protein [Candidatus Gracilibacteria bacterium]
MDVLDKNIPLNITKNLNEKFQMREYQKEAFVRFSYYIDSYKNKKIPIHLLYNMATGSGKTYVMAGLILSLYEKGYRNFLFFVNSTNIIEKTKDNFLNSNSSKYLFNDKIVFDGKQIQIKEVSNFSGNTDDNINIKFTTIHGLHTDMNVIGEGRVSYEEFKDKKIVIISDEAHHINTLTKNGNLNKTEQEEKTSWEYTIMKILNSHIENMLLEFTATIDLGNENISEKYLDKIIYRYDLKQFRLDGYSKEVDILKADMEQNDRILQALVLSQYRLKVAEKNKILCKPVILFKAQKTVAESENNLINFDKLIKELKPDQILNIKNKTNSEIILKAFEFFEESKISLDLLVNELKDDFVHENCISANDDSEAGKNQLLLNTLEDKNNRIRAVFAVQKLNEGWDVLNLFDIVRLYESRSNVVDKKTGKIKVGPQTISEAQLIGRGARYFPFVTEKTLGENKFKRKFDNKLDDLKILETFYYHTSFDSLYIAEIRQALRDIGIMDEKEKKDFIFEFKRSFKDSEFYKNGVIFTNEKKFKDYSNIDSFEKIGLQTKRYEFKDLFTGKSYDIEAFDDKKDNFKIEKEPKSILIKEIDNRIVRKAIQRNDFYKFSNLKSYLGKLQSIDEFIKSDNYLGNISIDFYSSKEVLENLTIENKLKAVSSLLNILEIEIKDKKVEYEGTKTFISKNISKYPFEKAIKVDLGVEGFGVNKKWFVFEKINGTSEEKSFIKMFEDIIQKLEKKYTNIYLIRNERTVAIYSFINGDRFEPDFILFMQDKITKQPFTYQIFIEPKGDQFKDSNLGFENSIEGWKQEFLLEIEDKAKILEMNFGNYKLIGLPFYSEKKENEFEKAFEDKFIK